MKYLTLASLLAIASMAPQYIYAEQSENQKTGNYKTRTQQSEMQEVVVTASFQPIQLKQSGSAITIISAKDIENSQATIVSDLLRDVPGLAVSRSGVMGSSTQLRVRGSEGNHVLVMIDGIEVNDPSQSDEFNWGHMPAMGIERIEVVRGSQSSLWGSDAMAGVINIITKQSDAPFQGGAYSEAGSHGANHTGFNVGGSGEKYHINLSGAHISTDGENISREGGEKDGYRNSTLNLKAGLQPLENLSFTLIGRQTEGENEFDPAPIAFPVDGDEESKFRQRFARVQADLSLLEDRWQQRVAVSVSRHNNKNLTDGSLTGKNSSRKKQLSYLSTLSWAESTQQLSFLVEHETEDFSQRGIVQPWGDPNQDRSRKNDGLALEYRVTLWDALTLAASVRHDDNSEFKNANTRRFEASYALPDSDTRLRAVYGTAVKNPSFSERFGFFTNFQGNPDLQPEESKSWEVGIDQTLLDGNLLLGVTYFRARLKNEIDGFVFDPMTFAFTSENVDGTSNREGVEVSLDASLSDRLTAKASYTYTDATERNDTRREIDEIRRPRHLASASINWLAMNNLNLSLNVQYNGEQKDQDFNSFPATTETLDDFTLVNLAANYQVNKQLSFYTRLENLMDENYEEVLGYQTLERGVYVGVRYNFSQ